MYTPINTQTGISSGQHPQSLRLQEEDLANLVLAELKRTAEEYTTAILEAQNPQIRNVLHNMLNRTLNDQARLFDTMKAFNLYEAPAQAQQQELQKSVQTKQQSWNRLQPQVQQFLNVRGPQQMQTQTSGQQFFS